MSLTYRKIQKSPRVFKKLFGVSVDEFRIILSRVEPEWQRQVIGSYKWPGRDYSLEVADMVLCFLLYYRSYTTQIFVGYLFGIDDSRVSRNIRILEPILSKVMAIQKSRHLSQKEVEEMLVDATEQPIEPANKRAKEILFRQEETSHP